MKKLFFSIVLITAVNTFATNAVVSAQSTQRWPFSGVVDIDYTLNKTTTKNTPVFRVQFFGRDDSGNVFELTNLTGDGSCGITLGDGAKRVAWDAKTQLGGNVESDNYEIGVFAEDVTDEATYLILDLETFKMTQSDVGPDVYYQAPCQYSEIWLRRVEQGTFNMGSDTNEPNRVSAREALHTVTITKPFYIAVFETTQGQYQRILGKDISNSPYACDSMNYLTIRGTNYGATWPSKTDHRVDQDSFLGTLRNKTGYGLIFDLPTEAQWEMAARDMGTTNRTVTGFLGSSVWNNGTSYTSAFETADEVAWYSGNTPGYYIQPVGLKAPSLLGLYDMHGNGFEWCLDWFTANISRYTNNPAGPPRGTVRIIRGGSKSNPADVGRIACRRYSAQNVVGLVCRLVLVEGD